MHGFIKREVQNVVCQEFSEHHAPCACVDEEECIVKEYGNIISHFHGRVSALRAHPALLVLQMGWLLPPPKTYP